MSLHLSFACRSPLERAQITSVIGHAIGPAWRAPNLFKINVLVLALGSNGPWSHATIAAPMALWPGRKGPRMWETLPAHAMALCDRIAFAENLIPYFHGSIGPELAFLN